MKKILWTVLIAFTLASMPIGGTALASQAHPVKRVLAKSGKVSTHALHARRTSKLAKKLQRQKTLAKHALKHAEKKT